jgi:hypothetical protein
VSEWANALLQLEDFIKSGREFCFGVHAGSDVVVLELKKSKEGSRRWRNYFGGNKVVVLEPITFFVTPLKAPATPQQPQEGRGVITSTSASSDISASQWWQQKQFINHKLFC